MAQLKLLLLLVITILIALCRSDTVEQGIQKLSEDLFNLNAQAKLYSRIKVRPQEKIAPKQLQPLLEVGKATLDSVPTIVKLRALFGHFNMDAAVPENTSPQKQRAVNDFLEEVLKTEIMKLTMKYLKSKSRVKGDNQSQKNLLKTIWFDNYNRIRGNKRGKGSCGFEHVFMNELKGNDLSGLHCWIYYFDIEHDKRHLVNYQGHIKSTYFLYGQTGERVIEIIKYRVAYKGVVKPSNSMFIGTLPEFDMALYTLCLVMKMEECRVKLGGKLLTLKVYPLGSYLGTAFPVI